MKTLIPQMVGRLLGDATLLTRSGRLREATAAIQRALGGAGLAPQGWAKLVSNWH